MKLIVRSCPDNEKNRFSFRIWNSMGTITFIPMTIISDDQSDSVYQATSNSESEIKSTREGITSSYESTADSFTAETVPSESDSTVDSYNQESDGALSTPDLHDTKDKNSEDKIDREISPHVSGVWGTVPWEWKESTATLILKGGNVGTVASAPWKIYTDVQRIIAEDTVVLQPNAANLFSNLSNLIYIDALSFDTSQVTTFDYLFANSNSLEVLDLNGWDTRSVRTVNRTFNNMISLRELNISSWDMTNLSINSGNSWFIFEARNLRTIHLGENTTFLHLGSSSPRFPSGAPSNEYTGNWYYAKDSLGNEVQERVVAPRSTLLSNFYDGTRPGTYKLERWHTLEINPIDSMGRFVADKQTIRGGYFETYEINPP